MMIITADIGTLCRIIPYFDLYMEYGNEAGVSPVLIAAQDKVESNFNPNAVGKAGEKGLGQFLDSTWRAHGHGDVFNPKDNIRTHARYLSWLHGILADDGKCEWGWAVAAYNCGIGKALKATRFQDLPSTTLVYVDKVYSQYARYVSEIVEFNLKINFYGKEGK